MNPYFKHILVGVSTYKVASWVEKTFFKKKNKANDSKEPDQKPNSPTTLPDTRGGDIRVINIIGRIIQNFQYNSALKIAIVATMLVSGEKSFYDSLRLVIQSATPNLLNQTLTASEIQSSGDLLRIIYLLQKNQVNLSEFNQLLLGDQITKEAFRALSIKDKIVLVKETIADAGSIDSPVKKQKLLLIILFLLLTLFGNTTLINLPAFSALIAQLLELLKEGKLSKRVLKKLIALLIEKGYELPPELITMINSENVTID